ncbi:hypothetical protein Bhyg_12199 [Pseudolycoriella hygida]|uniref:Uncharacterized protein n=1 Tax=Pseudolycoriella hygida TaxID=35572 RepID=A0A9Q0MY57_9DIPT|nr:hypothetical protein Bhyg_12199 [Pseudolycoriella hygida]
MASLNFCIKAKYVLNVNFEINHLYYTVGYDNAAIEKVTCFSAELQYSTEILCSDKTFAFDFIGFIEILSEFEDEHVRRIKTLWIDRYVVDEMQKVIEEAHGMNLKINRENEKHEVDYLQLTLRRNPEIENIVDIRWSQKVYSRKDNEEVWKKAISDKELQVKSMDAWLELVKTFYMDHICGDKVISKEFSARDHYSRYSSFSINCWDSSDNQLGVSLHTSK